MKMFGAPVAQSDRASAFQARPPAPTVPVVLAFFNVSDNLGHLLFAQSYPQWPESSRLWHSSGTGRAPAFQPKRPRAIFAHGVGKWTHDSSVPGSNPGGPTKLLRGKAPGWPETHTTKTASYGPFRSKSRLPTWRHSTRGRFCLFQRQRCRIPTTGDARN
jgi:hypothetical protein